MSYGAANPPRPPAGMICVGYRPVTGDLKDSEGRPYLRYDYAPAKPPRERVPAKPLTERPARARSKSV